MISPIDFARRASEAVAIHKDGLIRGQAVDIDGNVDTIGAYAYCYDGVCQEAVDQLIAGRKTLDATARRQLQVAAAERAHCVVYEEAGQSRLVHVLIQLNDLDPEEPPKQRQARMLKALKAGKALLEIQDDAS